MLFWVIYVLSVFFISFYLSKNISKNLRLYFFVFTFTLLITPSGINAGQNELAPALFVFLFDIVLEKNFSTFSLRTLALSLPITLFFVFLISILKRKFFQKKAL